MEPRFNGSDVSILSPQPPASRLLIGMIVVGAFAIGAGSVYAQLAGSPRVASPPMLAAKADIAKPSDAASAVVATDFHALTAATGTPTPRPVTDGSATTAPPARVQADGASNEVAPGAADSADAKIPLPKPKPAQTKNVRRSTTVEVYTMPDGQQVSVHRPVKAGDSIFEPWSSFENAATPRPARTSRRVQLTRPGLFEMPF
jgi:hypothetical protein